MHEQNYSPTGGMPPVAAQPQQFTPYPPLAEAQKPKSQVAQVILVISSFLVAAIAIGLLVYVYVQWDESKTNVDGKINMAVAAAVAEQRDIDDAKLAEELKKPYLEFTGPDDYGRLSFNYPRTWSVYIAKDTSKGGDFEAYLNPRTVSPVSTSTRFALRVTIYDKQYTDVLKTFDNLINKNELTSSVFQVGENSGVRLEGAFSKDITGIAVLTKLYDKTVLIRTDTPEVNRDDFETLIQSIRTTLDR